MKNWEQPVTPGVGVTVDDGVFAVCSLTVTFAEYTLIAAFGRPE